MDSVSVAQFSSVLAALVPAMLVLGFFVVVWRTGSLHVLMRRIWLLVHGRQEISDPTIRAFVDEQTNLMSFRMFSGVRAASLEEAHQLIEWTKLNQVDIHKDRAVSGFLVWNVDLRLADNGSASAIHAQGNTAHFFGECFHRANFVAPSHLQQSTLAR